MTFILFIDILTAHICEMKNSAGVSLNCLPVTPSFVFFWIF